VVILAILCLLPGCEDKSDLPYAPENCNEQKPAFGEIHLRITINAENPSVPVTVYRGNYDDGIVVTTETFTTTTGSILLDTEERYSATASYRRGPDTILVLDEAEVGVSSEEFRDATCWTVHDGSMDLQLATK
jgi:hypothetical protein